MAAQALNPGHRRFKVKVLQEDIDKARQNNSYKCVVAQAIARTVPDASHIEVDLQSIRFTRADTGERLLYLTPNIAAGYVVAFDAGEDIHPFHFMLTTPIPLARKVRTKAGRKIDNAAEKARKATRKPQLAPSAKGASPSVPVGADPQSVAEALKEQYAEAKKTETVSKGARRPRTFKTGKRVYGSRILRVNRYLREDT